VDFSEEKMQIRTSTLLMDIFLIGLLCVMSALWSCSSGLPPSSVPADTPAEHGGIRIYTKSEVYSTGTSFIELIIENTSGGEIAFGLEWSAEVKLGDRWYKLPFKEPITIPDIARTVSSGESGSLNIDLSTLDFKIEAGTYRIVKSVGDVTLAAEFKVEESK